MVRTEPAVSARERVIGRAGVESVVVVTVGAGPEEGVASSVVDCWRIRALLVPSLVLPLGTQPFVLLLLLPTILFEFDGGLGARREGGSRAEEGVCCCSLAPPVL